jgi:hypothetical protein
VRGSPRRRAWWLRDWTLIATAHSGIGAHAAGAAAHLGGAGARGFGGPVRRKGGVFLFQVLLTAGGATGFEDVVRAANEFFEFVSAGFAKVFVDRHGFNNIIYEVPIRGPVAKSPSNSGQWIPVPEGESPARSRCASSAFATGSNNVSMESRLCGLRAR